MTLSLKDEILEKLHLKKGGQKTASKNISKATKDFAKSDAPQFRGKSQEKRHEMAVAAGLSAARGESAKPKTGAKMIYEGKQVVVRSINENTGMAIVKLPKLRDPKIVRMCDLTAPQQLTEGILGIAPIAPTYRDAEPSKFIRLDLDPEDIGLLWEADEEPDNGSNISRHESGKKEVDEIPAPSDTIAPAYTDEKPPKEMGTPLSIEPGHTVATDPDFDGYDYPADAPNIPRPDFEGDENGNPRPPHWGNIHNAGEGLENREHDDERTDEDFDRSHHEYPGQEPSDDWHRQQERRRKRGLDTGGSHYTQKKSDQEKQETTESFDFLMFEDDMLGGDEHEPKSGDTITVTLPAMASIVCTVASKMRGDQNLMKSMIEALAEVGHGKTLDMPDLEDVAAHMNGEETHEIENREGGHPEHQGIEISGGNGGIEVSMPSDKWPGDGEKSGTGKTKLMGGLGEGEEEDVEECDDEMKECDDEMKESTYYSWDDIVADSPKLTYEQELREMKRRAGLKFWA